MARIDFNPELFNPLYWHLEKYAADKNIRYIFMYGGSSSAKTYSVSQKTAKDALAESDRYMVLRKYGSDIEESIYSDFTGIISDWGLSRLYRSIKNRIHTAFGGYIRFRGLDDSEKIKGISKFKRVVMEEMSQFDHEDFKQIRKRLRGRPGQQIWGMWNPISEKHWIKKHVIDTQEWEDLPTEIEGRPYSRLYTDGTPAENSFVRINKEGNTILIKTTYRDNFWIVGHPDKPNVGFRDVHTIADFEFDRINDPAYYDVYANGNWGKLDTGAEFYKSFKPAINVAKVEYNPALPLHLSFDENVNPYLSCTIWQAEGNEIRQIDEVALEQPRNTLEHTLTEIRKRYRNHEAGMFLYGDATSRKADAKLEKGYNFYTLIQNGLQQYHPATRVPLSNPSVMLRGIFLNQLFQLRFPGYTVTIGDNCQETIQDLRYTKEAADGTKLKEKVKDPKTGVSYEPYGHLSDTVDYYVCKYFESKFSEFKTGTSTQKRMAIKAAPANIF